MLRSRSWSRWSQNYLRVETWSRNRSRNYIFNKIYCNQFGGCLDEEKPPLRRMSYGTVHTVAKYGSSWSWSRNLNYGQSWSRSRKINNFGSAKLRLIPRDVCVLNGAKWNSNSFLQRRVFLCGFLSGFATTPITGFTTRTLWYNGRTLSHYRPVP